MQFTLDLPYLREQILHWEVWKYKDTSSGFTELAFWSRAMDHTGRQHPASTYCTSSLYTINSSVHTPENSYRASPKPGLLLNLLSLSNSHTKSSLFALALFMLCCQAFLLVLLNPSWKIWGFSSSLGFAKRQKAASQLCFLFMYLMQTSYCFQTQEVSFRHQDHLYSPAGGLTLILNISTPSYWVWYIFQ